MINNNNLYWKQRKACEKLFSQKKRFVKCVWKFRINSIIPGEGGGHSEFHVQQWLTIHWLLPERKKLHFERSFCWTLLTWKQKSEKLLSCSPATKITIGHENNGDFISTPGSDICFTTSKETTAWTASGNKEAYWKLGSLYFETSRLICLPARPHQHPYCGQQ